MPLTKRRSTSALALAAAGALALTGCAAGTASAADEPVVIEYNAAGHSWLGIIAEQQGFFDANGVDAELEQIDNGTLATSALASGDITLAFADLSLVAPYLNEGLDLTAVTATGPLSWNLVVPAGADTAPFPEGVRALSGARIGVPALGSVAYYYARAYFEAAGIDPDSVEYVAYGGFAQLPQVLGTGQIDVGVATTDQTFLLEQTGTADVLLDAETERDRLGGGLETVVGEPGSFYWAQREWAAEDPERVANVQRALAQAQEWSQDPANIDAVVAHLDAVSVLPSTLDEQGKRDYAGYTLGRMSIAVTPAQLDAGIAFWRGNGLLTAEVDAATLLQGSAPATDESVAELAVTTPAPEATS